MVNVASLGALLIVVFTPACQEDQTLLEPGGDPASGATAVDVDQPVRLWRCDLDGEFGVSVAAHGLESLDGARVWLSAVEPNVEPGDEDEVVVLLGGRVKDGAFKLACEHGLRTNYSYPSLAVVVDRDGDGRCSAADQAFRMQMYGWADAQEYGLTAAAVETPWPMEDAWQAASEVPPLWGDLDLCRYHFAAL